MAHCLLQRRNFMSAQAFADAYGAPEHTPPSTPMGQLRDPVSTVDVVRLCGV